MTDLNTSIKATQTTEPAIAVEPVLAPVIIKPIHAKPSLYSFYFEVIKEIGLKYGYNIVLHGSMNRDLDLIAIPWEEIIGDKEQMINDISESIGGNILMQNRSVDNIEGDRFGIKPHGRIVYIININRDFEIKFNGMVSKIKEYADPQYYIDLSVMVGSL
ncbi:hypothetical protein SDC9_17671 [bioreactor metagenome]|uniref:Uncharacterized protein n=1 Tax=bioreactor metagenome TaxID=1076179 RepID=A0A644U0C7_9ZZZZ|nr:hypothetical protein [Lentimicrobium sp.]MEA5111691.1 hypothetical protein [Lentimicrobium sp.]